MKKHLPKICTIALVILVLFAVAIKKHQMVPAPIDLDPENIESCIVPLKSRARQMLTPPGDYPLTESESEQLIEYLDGIVQNRSYKIRPIDQDGGWYLFKIKYTDGSAILVDIYSTNLGNYLRIDGYAYRVSLSTIEAMYDACYERILQEPNREELVIK